MRARILAYGEEVEKALNSSDENGKIGGGEEEEGEEGSAEEGGETTAMPDANVKYAKLKVQLSEIQRAQAAQKRATKGKGDRKGTEPVSSEQERWMEAQVDVLKDKIQTVESDYTFRKVDAGAFCFVVPFQACADCSLTLLSPPRFCRESLSRRADETRCRATGREAQRHHLGESVRGCCEFSRAFTTIRRLVKSEWGECCPECTRFGRRDPVRIGRHRSKRFLLGACVSRTVGERYRRGQGR